MTVDSVKNVGEWTSIAVWNNEPVISYYDNTNRHLKLAWRQNGIWQATTIDTGANTGQYTSLVIISGKPAVSFRSNGDLKYITLIGNDPTNPLDWQTSLIDMGNITYNTLISYGDHPAIAYFDNAQGDFRFAMGF